MNAAEQRYATEDRADTRVFRSFSGLKIQSYTFDGQSYLGFASSHDVWGDGSIVLVPAPSHTPGSIVAFITLPTGKRFALIGDIMWRLDGIRARAGRQRGPQEPLAHGCTCRAHADCPRPRRSCVCRYSPLALDRLERAHI